MDELEEIRLIFFTECAEQLAILEGGLLALSSSEGSQGPDINAMFRAVHSIKGGAGAFDMVEIVRFAHVLESTMDEVRANRLEITRDLVQLLLRAADVLADLVNATRDGEAASASRTTAVVAELENVIGAPVQTDVEQLQDELDQLFAIPALIPDPVPGLLSVEQSCAREISFRPGPGLYRNAGEPLLLLRELASLGSIETTVALDPEVLLGAGSAQAGSLTWYIRLDTCAPTREIAAIFEFFDNDCELTIVDRSGPSLREGEAVVQPVILNSEAGAAPDTDTPGLGPQTSVVPSSNLAPMALVERPQTANTAPARKDTAAGPTIRVDLERVDRLINLLGELVINQAMLAQSVAEAGQSKERAIETCMAELEQLTREIQEGVMAVRAQPVKTVFQRMTRVTREAAAVSGKQVQLVFEGESTEVDKTIIERLSDPLTHMIRNAVDHGLEAPARRLEDGKSETGTIRLRAGHRSGRVVIEVTDDGCGINRQRVRKIATERGLIPADAQLTDEETDQLLFLPGFSTAQTISDISGRGVGMDVVKQAIADMGGRISIESDEGRGTTFSLSLPLTLAVLDGIVVKVDEHTLVVPITAVIESLQLSPNCVTAITPGSDMFMIRKTYLPVIHMARALGFPGGGGERGGVALLLEAEGGRRAVVVADKILGQRQVVIKSLESNYQQVPGIAAATILGNGRVGLIVDVERLLANANPATETIEQHQAAA